MNSNITEELFFTGLIGNVSIDSIIPYILKMETAEYNSQDSDPTEWHPVTPAPSTVDFKNSWVSAEGTLFVSWTQIQSPAAAPCFLMMHGAKTFSNPWQINLALESQDDTWNVFWTRSIGQQFLAWIQRLLTEWKRPPSLSFLALQANYTSTFDLSLSNSFSLIKILSCLHVYYIHSLTLFFCCQYHTGWFKKHSL